ncbi:MAG TPA: hypothetical protein VIG07_00520 [Methylomirabilota bacterium]|jgi:hypothetical protein
MSDPSRTRRTPTPKARKSARSPETIARAAVAHEAEAVLGGKVKLTLRVTLSRAQAERLTARAISEGKNLNTLVAEILGVAPTEPTA